MQYGLILVFQRRNKGGSHVEKLLIEQINLY